MSGLEIGSQAGLADAGIDFTQAHRTARKIGSRLRRVSEIALTVTSLCLIMFGALLLRAMSSLPAGTIH